MRYSYITHAHTHTLLFAARIDSYVLSLRMDNERLVSAVVVLEADQGRSRANLEAVCVSMQALSERVLQLTAHCDVVLVNDSLREWHAAQADRAEKSPADIAVRVWVGRREG